MKSLLRLSDYSGAEVHKIFKMVKELEEGAYKEFLKGKTVVMFFPHTSIRTRVTFEKAIYLLGGQTILFPPEVLDKKEAMEDVVGYLNNWVDVGVVRHRDISLMENMRRHAKFPIINAMTDVNHPCEILADLYALSQMGRTLTDDKFLFVGPEGNIGRAWKEAAELMGFKLTQSCPKGYEIEGVEVVYNLEEAIVGQDIICTDSLNSKIKEHFNQHQVTLELMKKANKGAVLNPCPPFFRGEEVSAEVIESPFFVGYQFKKVLLEVQQAIIIYSLLYKE